jgi:hypothetical protein
MKPPSAYVAELVQVLFQVFPQAVTQLSFEKHVHNGQVYRIFSCNVNMTGSHAVTFGFVQMWALAHLSYKYNPRCYKLYVSSALSKTELYLHRTL